MDTAYFDGWVGPSLPASAGTDTHMYAAVIGGPGQNLTVYGYTSAAGLYQVASNQGGVTTPNGLSLGGGPWVGQYSNCDNRLDLENAAHDPVDLSVGNNNADTTFTGRITGPGSLTKIGGGTLTLAGTDDYTGGTTVLGGTLDILSADALPGGTMLTLSSTASVVFASDLAHAIQLELLSIDPPGMGGDDRQFHFAVLSTGSHGGAVPEPGTVVAASRRRAGWRRCLVAAANPKYQARNPKQIQSTKRLMTETPGRRRFVRISGFEIRICL